MPSKVEVFSISVFGGPVRPPNKKLFSNNNIATFFEQAPIYGYMCSRNQNNKETILFHFFSLRLDLILLTLNFSPTLKCLIPEMKF